MPNFNILMLIRADVFIYQKKVINEEKCHLNTLWTGDADLRLYITAVRGLGWRSG